MPLDRGNEYDETQGETKPKSLEQQIDETRPERAAYRAEPANWHRVDFTNRPDFLDKWGLEPEPYTPEELELARQYKAEEANVDYEAAGEVYTDEHGKLRPEHAWLVHEAPPPEGASLTRQDVADVRREADQVADQRAEPGNASDEPTDRNNPEQLHRFGNKAAPREVRPGDFELPRDSEPDSLVGPYAPRDPTDEVGGVSTFVDPFHPAVKATGQYHRLPPGFAPARDSGLGIHADGRDVDDDSEQPWGHRTIYPTEQMTLAEFSRRVAELPWEYVGKKR